MVPDFDAIEAVVYSLSPDAMIGIGNAERLGVDAVSGRKKPFLRVNNGGATGISAAAAAYYHVASGMYDVVLTAGADKVGMPNQIGGFHMATMLMRPHVIDILDILSTNSSADLKVQEIPILKNSGVSGHKLENVLKHAEGVSVLALNSSSGVSQVHPTGREVLYPGDRLIVMGTQNQLHSLQKIV